MEVVPLIFLCAFVNSATGLQFLEFQHEKMHCSALIPSVMMANECRIISRCYLQRIELGALAASSDLCTCSLEGASALLPFSQRGLLQAVHPGEADRTGRQGSQPRGAGAQHRHSKPGRQGKPTRKARGLHK